jgi:hypothetical protein
VSILDRLVTRHLTDADFAGVWADAQTGASEASAAQIHLRECAECRGRYASFTGWLETLRTDARAEADEAFPPERLAAQQAQVLRRLEALGRPARIIRFPRFAGPVSIQHGGRQRWIAAAAAAGLIVGVGVGRMVDLRAPLFRQPNPIAAPTQIARTPDRTGIQPASLSVSDELLMYDGDVMGSPARVPEALRPIHEITPSARDYDPR